MGGVKGGEGGSGRMGGGSCGGGVGSGEGGAKEDGGEDRCGNRWRREWWWVRLRSEGVKKHNSIYLHFLGTLKVRRGRS